MSGTAPEAAPTWLMAYAKVRRRSPSLETAQRDCLMLTRAAVALWSSGLPYKAASLMSLQKEHDSCRAAAYCMQLASVMCTWRLHFRIPTPGGPLLPYSTNFAGLLEVGRSRNRGTKELDLYPPRKNDSTNSRRSDLISCRGRRFVNYCRSCSYAFASLYVLRMHSAGRAFQGMMYTAWIGL